MIWKMLKLVFICLMMETLMEDRNQHLADSKTVPPSSTYESRILKNNNRTGDGVSGARTNATAEPEGLAQLLKEIKLCRQKYLNINNTAFYSIVYKVLKGIDQGESIVGCNITKDAMAKIQMPVLDVLKMSNNNEAITDESRVESRPTARENGLRWNLEPSNGLELELGHNWMENNPSASHLSHIYIGRPMYPIITEVSRVLQKSQTIPLPSTTRPFKLPKI